MKPDYHEFIGNVIHEHAKLQIDICDDHANIIGHLFPLTISALKDEELIQQMTRWRNFARQFFLTQFIATPERTKYWLESVVFQDNSRLLFLIYSQTKCIGQYGFKNLNGGSAEIDNLIRGEIGGHPQLIYFAELALLQWMFNFFSLEKVFGYVLSDNPLVLDLHRSVGFNKVAVVPLQRVELGDEVHLLMGSPGKASADGKYCQQIEITKSKFSYLGVNHGH
jgi:hypothetical protein